MLPVKRPDSTPYNNMFHMRETLWAPIQTLSFASSREFFSHLKAFLLSPIPLPVLENFLLHLQDHPRFRELEKHEVQELLTLLFPLLDPLLLQTNLAPSKETLLQLIPLFSLYEEEKLFPLLQKAVTHLSLERAFASSFEIQSLLSKTSIPGQMALCSLLLRHEALKNNSFDQTLEFLYYVSCIYPYNKPNHFLLKEFASAFLSHPNVQKASKESVVLAFLQLLAKKSSTLLACSLLLKHPCFRHISSLALFNTLSHFLYINAPKTSSPEELDLFFSTLLSLPVIEQLSPPELYHLLYLLKDYSIPSSSLEHLRSLFLSYPQNSQDEKHLAFFFHSELKRQSESRLIHFLAHHRNSSSDSLASDADLSLESLEETNLEKKQEA